MSLWSLCINLQGPMQSWGIDSKLSLRSTSTMPSRSGIIGLLASSMGIEREDEESLAQLNKLRINTISLKNIDYVEKDYQTIEGVLDVSGKIKTDMDLSTRYYITNSFYIAVIEGEKDALEKIMHALKYPKWLVFLGRKSCPSASPFLIGESLKEGSFEELFSEKGTYRCFKELSSQMQVNNYIVRSDFDFPISFNTRKFEKRTYVEDWVDISKIKDAINPIFEYYKDVSKYDKFY
ncbi:type I-E CRISPR-associated protein Cas5/CasD [Fluviispira multicolorata]|uniref:Type I-E CRISPR-associated protein Cas5/CasD n=1 Tax=Fluviispira multicolorata TaxID=2654512 RepID=A0A833JE89_9BACT|nr:type I-E CRISPR-associated protein Cas5/CasD [Fluviispira multicolorata]KAB8032263.1 type I-E CRISPR-associated protein Cas5/CasD [Fluviispira multicolorata]